MSHSSIASTIPRAICDPSRSLVDANDSLHSSIDLWPDEVGDRAHPGQFLIELAVRHGVVFLTLEVRENTVGDVRAQRLRR